MNYPSKTDYCRNLQYYAPGTRFSRIFVTFNYVLDKDGITPLQKNDALDKMRLDEEKFKKWIELLKEEKLIELAASFEEVGE